MPMTANAGYIKNIFLYKGTEPLETNYFYSNDDDYAKKFVMLYESASTSSDPAGDTAKQVEAIFAPVEEAKSILLNELTKNKLDSQTGYTQIGWRLWNASSGCSLWNPFETNDTAYEIKVPATASESDSTSVYATYIATDPEKYIEYMAIEPIWDLDYKITQQPTNAEPYVEINEAGKNEVSKCEWYSFKDKEKIPEITIIESDGVKYGVYDSEKNILTSTMSSDGTPNNIKITLTGLTKGNILQICPQSGSEVSGVYYDDVLSTAFVKDDSTGVYSDEIPDLGESGTCSIQICSGGTSESGFSVQVKELNIVGTKIGESTEIKPLTCSDYGYEYCCKVTFTNGGTVNSEKFIYTRSMIRPNETSNGSYKLQVDGKDITEKASEEGDDLLAIPGTTVTVVPTPETGYELDTIKVTLQESSDESEEIPVTNNTFTMPDDPVNVDVTFKIKTYEITLPTDPVGYTVNPALEEGVQITSVEHGDNYAFNVEISDGYTATDNFAVKANGTALEIYENGDNAYFYIIEKVTEAQTITVDGVNKLHDIAISESTGGSYTVTDKDGSNATIAVVGTEFTIAPTPAEGYELDKITVTQKDGSNTPVSVDDKNQFTMPDYPVEVSVTFKKKTYGITLPQGQTGYTVTSSQTSPVEHGSDYTFKVTISDGYDVPTALSVKANGNALVATTVSGKEYTYTLEKVASAQEITVDGVSDITGPEVTITLDAENTWKHFLFKIGFGLFFKEEKKLTIDAVDTGSGRGSVTYYVSETDLFPAEETYSAEEIEKRIPQWTEYSGAVFITVDRSYVVYAKATDIAGNVTYVSTSGMVIDTTKPVISGLEDGGQYYGDTATTISDANLSAVKLDGKAVEFTGTSASVTITADGAEHTIEAADKAGNQTVYKVTVSETWVRDGISSAGSRALKLGVPYKFGTGKWKVAGDTTVYEGGNTFYASEGGTFEFQTQ